MYRFSASATQSNAIKRPQTQLCEDDLVLSLMNLENASDTIEQTHNLLARSGLTSRSKHAGQMQQLMIPPYRSSGDGGNQTWLRCFRGGQTGHTHKTLVNNPKPGCRKTPRTGGGRFQLYAGNAETTVLKVHPSQSPSSCPKDGTFRTAEALCVPGFSHSHDYEIPDACLFAVDLWRPADYGLGPEVLSASAVQADGGRSLAAPHFRGVHSFRVHQLDFLHGQARWYRVLPRRTPLHQGHLKSEVDKLEL
ncbi:hypothetical protein HPB47_000843 [Ixodes persulcatus]|uniref:Uncharacterized protein n=1 Tax=Ixodes persulcatus TaxID=34615 RepID=A0AC60PS49_IXOPE|nr:hypothetical protein HPB47_000843 [Ixodes persulcatus]